MTFENGRGVADIPAIVEVVAAPAPLVVSTTEAEDAATAVRGPQTCAIEVDVGRVAIGRQLEAVGDEMLVLPEVQKDSCIESNITRIFETLLLHFANHNFLARLQHCF